MRWLKPVRPGRGTADGASSAYASYRLYIAPAHRTER